MKEYTIDEDGRVVETTTTILSKEDLLKKLENIMKEIEACQADLSALQTKVALRNEEADSIYALLESVGGE